jgi:hypothetical protein
VDTAQVKILLDMPFGYLVILCNLHTMSRAYYMPLAPAASSTTRHLAADPAMDSRILPNRSERERGGRRRGKDALFSESVGVFYKIVKERRWDADRHRSLVQGLKFDVSILALNSLYTRYVALKK